MTCKSAVAVELPANPILKTMGDKNPKAKQKLQAQHEMHRKQKADQHLREQQRLHELHELKHPHEPKG